MIGPEGPEAPRHIVGEVAGGVAVVYYVGYGRRLVPLSRTRRATTTRRRCLHGRPTLAALETIQPNAEATSREWAAVCRLCEYELWRLDLGDHGGIMAVTR